MKILRIGKEKAVQVLADKIASELRIGKRVLWLIPGASNIPLAILAMDRIKKSIPAESLADLTVTLTDERFGPVGHADSNWRELLDKGFPFDSVSNVPVLTGLSRVETTKTFEYSFEEAFRNADVCVAQFGMGADGHIAGVLPHSVGVGSKRSVVSYDAPPYVRVTLTLDAIRKVSVAYAFVFGESKRQIIADLEAKTVPLDDMPAQILKEIAESYLITDEVYSQPEPSPATP
jgi:6-phosphogluconolactonase/glucosamine-6-phosphate isomerase/deaminase